MANIKSQIKRNITNEKSRQNNISLKSSTRTAVKDVRKAVESKNKEIAAEKLVIAFSRIDKCAASGIYHTNKAARDKSRLSKLVSSLSA